MGKTAHLSSESFKGKRQHLHLIHSILMAIISEDNCDTTQISNEDENQGTRITETYTRIFSPKEKSHYSDCM